MSKLQKPIDYEAIKLDFQVLLNSPKNAPQILTAFIMDRLIEHGLAGEEDGPEYTMEQIGSIYKLIETVLDVRLSNEQKAELLKEHSITKDLCMVNAAGVLELIKNQYKPEIKEPSSSKIKEILTQFHTHIKKEICHPNDYSYKSDFRLYLKNLEETDNPEKAKEIIQSILLKTGSKGMNSLMYATRYSPGDANDLLHFIKENRELLGAETIQKIQSRTVLFTIIHILLKNFCILSMRIKSSLVLKPFKKF